jgi:hypothetical protein
MKPARARAFLYSRRGEAKVDQLTERKDAMLFGRQRRDRRVERGGPRNMNPWLRFSASLGHAAMVDGKASCVGDAV